MSLHTITREKGIYSIWERLVWPLHFDVLLGRRALAVDHGIKKIIQRLQNQNIKIKVDYHRVLCQSVCFQLSRANNSARLVSLLMRTCEYLMQIFDSHPDFLPLSVPSLLQTTKQNKKTSVLQACLNDRHEEYPKFLTTAPVFSYFGAQKVSFNVCYSNRCVSFQQFVTQFS